MIMMMMIMIIMRIMMIMMMTVMIITIRDGPLEKVIGGGGVWGICRLHEFIFRSLLVQEFCFQVKPSARILFSDKYRIAFF